MGTTFIKGRIFKEVFEKYSPKLENRQADLSSEDEPAEQIVSEDQEQQEQEERIFLQEQRTSSKNSKGSSSK